MKKSIATHAGSSQGIHTCEVRMSTDTPPTQPRDVLFNWTTFLFLRLCTMSSHCLLLHIKGTSEKVYSQGNIGQRYRLIKPMHATLCVCLMCV